jgi:hypothetical protein
VASVCCLAVLVLLLRTLLLLSAEPAAATPARPLPADSWPGQQVGRRDSCCPRRTLRDVRGKSSMELRGERAGRHPAAAQGCPRRAVGMLLLPAAVLRPAARGSAVAVDPAVRLISFKRPAWQQKRVRCWHDSWHFVVLPHPLTCCCLAPSAAPDKKHACGCLSAHVWRLAVWQGEHIERCSSSRSVVVGQHVEPSPH